MGRFDDEFFGHKPMYYTLDAEHHVVPCDLMTWARMFEKKERQVACDEIGPVVVSTVFLGLDHRFWGYGPPIVFETMVFDGSLDREMWRYSSWDDAVTGHAAAVRKVKEAHAKWGLSLPMSLRQLFLPAEE